MPGFFLFKAVRNSHVKSMNSILRYIENKNKNLHHHSLTELFYRVSVIVFNATFNNISVISWQSVLLVEYPEKTTKKLYHIMLYQLHLVWVGFELTTLVVIGTDCIGSCKSNYHTITTTTAPHRRSKINYTNISLEQKSE